MTDQDAASPLSRWRLRDGTVEAVRWDGSPVVLAVLDGWGAEPDLSDHRALRVWGPRGYAGAFEGDWLVRDKAGNGVVRWVPDQFEATFEAVPASRDSAAEAAVPESAEETARLLHAAGLEVCTAAGVWSPPWEDLPVDADPMARLARDCWLAAGGRAYWLLRSLEADRDGATSVLDRIRAAHRRHPGVAEFGAVVEEILHREYGQPAGGNADDN